MTKEETKFLLRTIGGCKVIVEVGCYKGVTTCALAEYNKVIAIDPFIPNYNKDEELAGK